MAKKKLSLSNPCCDQDVAIYEWLNESWRETDLFEMEEQLREQRDILKRELNLEDSSLDLSELRTLAKQASVKNISKDEQEDIRRSFPNKGKRLSEASVHLKPTGDMLSIIKRRHARRRW